MADRIQLEINAEDKGAARLLERLLERIEELERQVAALSGKPLDLETDPAENDVKRLVAELARLERAFERAQRAVNFQRARNELEGTTASARRLANAEATLAARGKELIEFSRRLPPELAKTAAGMDRVERQTEQAERAFRRFQAATAATRTGFSSLVSGINGLRAGLAGVVAALGIQQFAALGRQLIQLSSEAIAVKREFDRLEPTLRGILGSTELAGESVDFLRRTSEELKVATSGLIAPYVQLTAAVRETGLSLEENDRVFRAVVESGRAFGLTSEQIGRALTAVSQIAGKTVFSMEELRQQLGEAIPNAIPALAKGLGITVAEAIDKVSRGALTAAEGLPALARGLEELNRAAAENQLDTLGAQLDEITRLSEIAQEQFASGLAPGLREALDAVEEFLEGSAGLPQFFGEFGGEVLREAVTQLEAFAAALRVTLEEAERRSIGLVKLEDVIEGIATTLPVGGEAVRQFGERLQGIPQAGADAFEKIAADARELAGDVGDTAREVEEHYKGAFESAVEDFDLSVGDMAELAKGLASDIAAATEEQEAERQALFQATVAAQKASAEDRLRIEEEVKDRLVALDRERIAEQERIFAVSVEAAKSVAEQRVQAEARAAAEIGAFLDQVVAKARETGEQRAAADAEVSDKLVEIERDLQEKIDKLRDEAAEKLKKPKADRAEIARELAERIVEIERDAADKIRAEQERIAEEAEKAAERRRKAEESVQKALEKSIESYQKIVAAIQEAAEGAASEGGEREGGGFSKIAEQIEEARGALGDFIVDLEQLNAGSLIGDAGQLLADEFARLDEILGQSSTALGDWFAQGREAGAVAEETGGKLRDDFVAALADAAEAAEGLSGSVRSTVEEILRRYLDLAEGGQVTRDDFRALADELSSAFGGVGIAVGDDVAEIRQALDSLGEAQDEAGAKAQESGKKQEESAKGAAVAADEATKSIGQVGDEWEQVGDAVERAGIRIKRGADGLLTITDAAEKTEEAGKKAAEGIQAAGDAATTAGPALEQVADAAEAIPDEIVSPEEPERFRELGAAASEILPQIQPLAATLLDAAAVTERIAAVVPVLAEQAPILAEGAAAIFAAISESEVDLDALAVSLESIDEPLTAIETAVSSISEDLVKLPEPIAAVQTAAEPLFELARAAGEDDRFGKIAAGLQGMAAALPVIPEPMERLQASLEALATRREEIAETLKATAEGLRDVGSEETLARLVDLAGGLEELVELIGDVDRLTKSWDSTLGKIRDEMAETLLKLAGLSEELRDRLIPALVATNTETSNLREQVVHLTGAFEGLGASATAAGDAGQDAMERIRAGAAAANQELERMSQLLDEIAAKAQNVQLP